MIYLSHFFCYPLLTGQGFQWTLTAFLEANTVPDELYVVFFMEYDYSPSCSFMVQMSGK